MDGNERKFRIKHTCEAKITVTKETMDNAVLLCPTF